MNLKYFSKFICLGIIILSFPVHSSAQKNVLTAGFQFKPIFSNKFFNVGPQTKDSSNISFTIRPSGGYNVGAIIRYGLSETFSAETGINYVKRPYELQIKDGAYTSNTRFSIIGYEIPLSAIVFIRLSEKLFVDASLGTVFDFFPSNVQSMDTNFLHYSRRKSWIFPGVTGNFGFEYRTVKSGYFYFGASYHRPFSNIYTTTIGYYVDDTYKTGQQFLLAGNYLTIDFRYYFHEDPLKKQKKKKEE